MSSQKIFFQQFKDNFTEVGSVIPSSQILAEEMTLYLAARNQGKVRVLEVGSGTGAFTGRIVSLLNAGDIFDVVEINEKLITILEQRFENEPQLQKEGVEINFINDDVRNLPTDNRYDYIVFSLPLTNFPPKLVQEILDLMIERLKPGGMFSYVKYIFLGRLKYLFSGRAIKEEMKLKQTIISDFANKYQLERRVVLSNLPPAWTYYWQK